jgi:hypothetical protein
MNASDKKDEAFQQERRKHNVLLQIEKGLFLTCIVSESVTVMRKCRTAEDL